MIGPVMPMLKNNQIKGMLVAIALVPSSKYTNPTEAIMLAHNRIQNRISRGCRHMKIA